MNFLLFFDKFFFRKNIEHICVAGMLFYFQIHGFLRIGTNYNQRFLVYRIARFIAKSNYNSCKFRNNFFIANSLLQLTDLSFLHG